MGLPVACFFDFEIGGHVDMFVSLLHTCNVQRGRSGFLECTRLLLAQPPNKESC